MRKEIFKSLSTGVSEVSGRVYPLIMPQDTKRNSIVYRVIGTVDTKSITCIFPVDTAYIVQIDVFAHTYDQSVQIASKVEEVLRNDFVVLDIMNYEDYMEATFKYRQIINVQLCKKKQTKGDTWLPPLP